MIRRVAFSVLAVLVSRDAMPRPRQPITTPRVTTGPFI